MDYQSVPVLSATNFNEWRYKVKSELISYGPSVWKLVCDGYCKGSPSLQEQQWNDKERCVMYNNLHNKDLDIIIVLNFAKEIQDSLQLMHGETTSNSAEKERERGRRKNPIKRNFFN